MFYSIWRYRVHVAAVLVAITAVACGGGDGGGGGGTGAGGGSPPGTTPGTPPGTTPGSPPSADASCGAYVPPVGTKYEFVVDIFNSAGKKTGFDTFTKGEILPAITFNGNAGAFPFFSEVVNTPVVDDVAGTPKRPVIGKVFGGEDGTDSLAFGTEGTQTTGDGTETTTITAVSTLTPPRKRPLNPIQDAVIKSTATSTVTAEGLGTISKETSFEETFLGKEDITVPAGSFAGACKFKTTITVGGTSSTSITWQLPRQSQIVIQESFPDSGITRKLASYKVTPP